MEGGKILHGFPFREVKRDGALQSEQAVERSEVPEAGRSYEWSEHEAAWPWWLSDLMACCRPVRACQDSGGQVRIGAPGRFDGRELQLPCGKCIGCKMDRSRSWSLRIKHEAALYDSNVFATFTYADECLPGSLSLEYQDFQLMMKRLRKRLSGVTESPDGRRPIRFFAAGEYGSRYRRPHFHAILFNCHFPDSQRWWNGDSRSTIAEGLWRKGDVNLGDFSLERAAYVAGYTVEKRYGEAAKDHYEDVVNVATGEVSSRRPEFCQMSRGPGIGAWWYERYRQDLYKGYLTDGEGQRVKLPRYYFNKLLVDEPVRASQLKEEWIENAVLRSPEELAMLAEHLQGRVNLRPREH